MSIKYFFSSLVLLLLTPYTYSQTHLKLILKTTLPIDSVLVVHFTNKESKWMAFKDTLEMDFKTGKTDYYHINYTQKEKIFNQKVYLDSGSLVITMKIENDKLQIENVKGSPLFEKVETWKKQYGLLVQRKDTVALDSFLLKTYEEQMDNMFSFNIGTRYLDLHQNDKLKLYALLPLIARQDDELKKLFGFSFLNERLQGIINNNIITFSHFELITPGNTKVYASQHSKFIILDFWFTGCLPCIEDHRKIKELLPYLKQKQAEIISISNDDSYKKWKDYLKKNKYTWPNYKKPPASKSIISHLGISIYPTYILLNEAGKIIFSTYSLEEVVKQL